MIELKNVNKRAVQHPRKWQTNDFEYGYEILERYNYLCLVKCKDVSKGFTYYALANIRIEGNNETMGDLTLTDKDSQLNEKTMRRIFNEGVERSKGNEIRKQREAEQELREKQFSDNLMQKRRDCDELVMHLRTELKQINVASDNLSGIMKNKRGREILQELSQLEALLRYGMSFDRNDFNRN